MAAPGADELGTQEDRVEPMALRSALSAYARCAGRTAFLVLRRRLRQPRGAVGTWFSFADGTSAPVYRETVVEQGPPRSPCVLVVCFRLRHVHRRWGHALFRWESELNTALFAGFPGLLSKFLFRHDQHGRYRGLYEWDSPALAVSYVRALWWALAAVSEPGSIRVRVLPGLRRAQLEAQARSRCGDEEGPAWWRVIATADALRSRVDR
jgi:hypothetical protein